MDFAKTFKRFAEFEARVQKVVDSIEEIKKRQQENFDKIMQGFKCIERDFKCNCNGQLALCDMIDEITGSITDTRLSPGIGTVD